MIPEHDEPIHLSQSGIERREQMLNELLGEMKSVHRRRRIRRHVTVASLALIVFAATTAVWLSIDQRSRVVAPSPHDSPIAGNRSTNDNADEGTSPSVSPPSSMIVELVQTEPHIVDRYRVVAKPHVEILDDASLLRELAQLNRPAGLIRSEGRTWLTADVTDHFGG